MNTRVLLPLLLTLPFAACLLDRTGRGTPDGDGGNAMGGGGNNVGPGGGGIGGIANGGGGTGGVAQGGDGGVSIGGGGQGGTGGSDPVCGNGVIEAEEKCDDGNSIAADGCAMCNVADEFTCVGEPSMCTEIVQVLVNQLGTPIAIPDDENGYDGTVNTMACAELQHPGVVGTLIDDVEVTVTAAHTWVGDVAIKVFAPGGTVVLVLRPGFAETVDAYEFATNGSYDSNLLASRPLVFAMDHVNVAEDMGQGLAGQAGVCNSVASCDYLPTGDLTTLNGTGPVGTWRVCVGDAQTMDDGFLHGAALRISATAP